MNKFQSWSGKQTWAAVFLLPFLFFAGLVSHSQVSKVPANLCAVLQKVAPQSSTGFKSLRLGKVEISDHEEYVSSLQLDGHEDACAIHVNAYASGTTEWGAAVPLDEENEEAAITTFRSWYEAIRNCSIEIGGESFKFESIWGEEEDEEFKLEDGGIFKEMSLFVNENRMIYLNITLLQPGETLETWFVVLSVFEME